MSLAAAFKYLIADSGAMFYNSKAFPIKDHQTEASLCSPSVVNTCTAGGLVNSLSARSESEETASLSAIPGFFTIQLPRVALCTRVRVLRSTISNRWWASIRNILNSAHYHNSNTYTRREEHGCTSFAEKVRKCWDASSSG